MASKIPLVITDGQVRQLATADSIAVDNVLFYDDKDYQVNLASLAGSLGDMSTDTLLDRSISALSCTGTTLTYTLTATDGHGMWNFNGEIWPEGVASAAVNLVAGTDLAPQANYVNFQLVDGVPTLLASLTPQITPGCINVAQFLVGTVSGGAYTIYSYSRCRYEVNSLIRHAIQRFGAGGSLYESGLVPTTDIHTLSVGAAGTFYNGLFRMESNNAVTSAAFYYIKNGSFYAGTTLAELQFYSDGTAFSNHDKGNIVWGIVPTSTTADALNPTVVKLFAILPTHSSIHYTTLTTARQDLYETTNYYPPNDALHLTFVPIARTILDEDDENHFQTFDTGLYFKDLRGKITSGGGAASPSDLSGLVPYDGAIADVDLGVYDLAAATLKATSLTATRVPYAGAGGLLTDSANLTFASNILTVAGSITINTSGQTTSISNRYGADCGGANLWIGGGGLSSIGEAGATYKGGTNLSVGQDALHDCTTGYYNVGLGYGALYKTTSGAGNMAIGRAALYDVTTANNNTAIGSSACRYTTGLGNTVIGGSALYTNVSGDSNIAIGYEAGYYETGSNKLFIDNAARASEADGRVKALIYGLFASTAAAQDLVINGQLGINITPTAWLTLPANAAGAGLASMLITPGTVLSTPVSGSIESDGTHLYWTDSGGTRRTLDNA